MIQLVPSLKYNRSIDSAINLDLVNIQKQEQRQQGHASHILMGQFLQDGKKVQIMSKNLIFETSL